MTVDATDTFFVFHSEQLPVTFVSLPVMTTMTMMSDFGSNKTLDRDRNSFSTLLTFRSVATRARFGSVRTETPEAKLWLHEKNEILTRSAGRWRNGRIVAWNFVRKWEKHQSQETSNKSDLVSCMLVLISFLGVQSDWLFQVKLLVLTWYLQFKAHPWNYLMNAIIPYI